MFLIQHISSLFSQKNKFYNSQNDTNYLVKMFINQSNSGLKVTLVDHTLQFKLPITFNKLFNDIQPILQKKKIIFDNFVFFPFQQEVVSNNTSIRLNYIHCLILQTVCANFKEGAAKEDLYSKLWPQDKVLQLNKLDTHLTNLKNLFQEKLNVKIIFKSEKSMSLSLAMPKPYVY